MSERLIASVSSSFWALSDQCIVVSGSEEAQVWVASVLTRPGSIKCFVELISSWSAGLGPFVSVVQVYFLMSALKRSPLKAKEATANCTDGWLRFIIQLKKTVWFTKSPWAFNWRQEMQHKWGRQKVYSMLRTSKQFSLPTNCNYIL